MNIRCFLFIILAGLSVQKVPADAGTVQFIGAIMEPACVVDTTAQHTQILCTRAGIARTQNYGSTSITRALPWNLAVMTQTAIGQRRDIVMTYR